MQISYVVPKKARHGSVSPRVIVRLKQRTIERGLTRIKAQAGPGLLQAIAQIVLAGNEVKGSSLTFVSQNQIHHRVEWIFLLLGRDLCDRLAVKFLEIRVFNSGD